MTLAVVAHSCSVGHGVIIPGRGPWRIRLGNGGAGHALDLPPQIARPRRRLGQNPCGFLELRARDLVASQNHAPRRVPHRDVERRVRLDASQLVQGGHECGVGHPETCRVGLSATDGRCQDKDDTEGGSGAYHAARLGGGVVMVNAFAMLAGARELKMDVDTNTPVRKNESADLTICLGTCLASPLVCNNLRYL